ncbi:MAG: carboxypeptidase M32 [Anaerolineae bacterium]|nr:MAG: carboxypeptidase M32 [Anaerolineae bacterium]
MKEKLEQLKTLLAEAIDLQMAAAVLGWDQQVNMPSAGAETRGQQMATLQRLAHIKATSDEIGKLLDDLSAYTEELPPDSDEARLVKVARRDYEIATRVPADFVAEFTRLTAVAFDAWQKARAASDFALFRPHLERIVEMGRQYVEFFAPYEHPYDPLLDRFEPGMKTAEVKEIFDALRPQQVALIQEIGAAQQVDDSFLHGDFDEQKQWDFGVEVITRFGYDWSRGRQDKSAHPFTTSFSTRDVRITTRVQRDFLPSALFGTLHEGGHALYEQGVNPAYDRTSLAGGASLAVHESQSRTYENLVGRSLPFWEFFYPRLQEYFPAQLGNVDLQTFYRGINKVQPSLIRVEADEATYNLHIMLRLDLEIAMVEGSLEVRHLPDVWNTKMQEYLGITPPDDAQGVLQDVHWSSGLMGYFSTYALGNLIAAQLWEKVSADIPDLEDQFRRGEFGALLAWMREHIHQYGRKFEPQELVERATGSRITPEPYMRYLRRKYGEIYSL